MNRRIPISICIVVALLIIGASVMDKPSDAVGVSYASSEIQKTVSPGGLLAVTPDMVALGDIATWQAGIEVKYVTVSGDDRADNTNQVVWKGTPNKDRGKNPTIEEVVQYVFSKADAHKSPPKIPLSTCFWESGELRQYQDNGDLVQGKNIVNGILTSSDWGICQINDRYHPELMIAAKSDWKSSLEAGWSLLDKCWETYGKDRVDDVFACYHRPAAIHDADAEHYVSKVMPIYNSRYWDNYK